MTDESQTPPKAPVPWIKLLVPVLAFIAMLVWSNIPPYRAHIKKEGRDFFVWHWHLYHQGGAEVCDLRYYNMNEGGALIERWKLLGYETRSDMPDNVARIHHKQLRADQNRVCSALREAGDAAPNVELDARCGFNRGWKPIVTRKHNVCATTRSGRPKKSSAKAKKKPVQPRHEDDDE